MIKQDPSVNEEKTTGPFTVKVNKMRIATLKNNEDYDYLFMDEFQGKDTITVITLDIDQLIKVKPFFKIVLKVFLDEPALLYKKGMANKPSTCRKLT